MFFRRSAGCVFSFLRLQALKSAANKAVRQKKNVTCTSLRTVLFRFCKRKRLLATCQNKAEQNKHCMNIAIILSGGVGSRMGLDIPKQYAMVGGRPIISYCLKTFFENAQTDAVVVGVADQWKAFVEEQVEALHPSKPVYYAAPGETRQYSILSALREVKRQGYADDSVVIIHDGARPLVSHNLISRCYDACKSADGAMPVVAVKDTTYFSEDGKHITSLLDRSKLWAGQAPEAFVFGKYLAVHETMAREELLKINGSTEIAFKSGLNVELVKGDPMNFKITTPEDLSNFESIITTCK